MEGKQQVTAGTAAGAGAPATDKKLVGKLEMKLHPGQHLVIQTIQKDDVIERSYTPVPGDFAEVGSGSSQP